MDTTSINVGDGATYSVGSDRYPATVIAKTAKTLTFQSDDYRATPESNYYGLQSYTFSPNPNGALYKARWSTVRGGWVSKGFRFRVGHRGAYQNPSF
jgi:hypothetical protein